MTDIDKIGFGVDTAPLKTLNDQLDTTKQSVKGLNDELQKTPAASQSAATSLGQVSTAAQGVKNAGVETALQNVTSGLAKTADAASTMAAGMSRTADATKTVASVVDQSLSPAVQRATGFFGNFKQAFTEGFTNAINQANAPVAQAGQITKQLEDYVRATGLSYEQTAESMKKGVTAQAALNTATKDSGGFFNTLKNAVSGFGQSLTPTTAAVVEHTGKAKAMSEAHHGVSESSKEVRETLHTLEPILDSVGVKFSALSQFSGATRAGIGALALAITGTLLVELQKMADESKILQDRLEGLAGVKVGDHLAEQFEKAVNGASRLPASLSPAVESMVKLQQMDFDPHVIKAVGTAFESIGVSSTKSISAVQSLFESMRVGGATAADSIAETNKFFASLQSQGKLTEQSFLDLQKASPPTAQSIANIFTQGRLSATQYAATLKQHPQQVQDIISALQRMAQANDTAYRDMIQNPKTVGDALEKLKQKFAELTDAAQAPFKDGERQPGIVTRAINGLADALDEINTKGLPDAKRQFDLTANSTKQWGDMVKVVADENSVWGKSIEIDIVGATEKALIDIGNFAVQAPQSITDFVNRSIATMSSWAGGFVGAIQGGLNAAMQAISSFVSNAIAELQKVANAVANVASGQGGASGQQTASDVMGMAMGNGTMAPQSSGADPAATSLGGGSPELGYFASGGSFVVGGSGGTDSQLIQFMATPGEKVTIDPPGGGAAAQGGKPTLGSLMPATGANAGGATASSDGLSSQVTDALKTQTQDLKDAQLTDRNAIVAAVTASTSQIVTALQSLITAAGGVAAANTTSSAGTSSTSSSGGGGGGGGGGGKTTTEGEFGTPWSLNDVKATTPQQQQTMTPQQWAQLNGNGNTVSGGTSTGQRGFVSGSLGAQSVGADGKLYSAVGNGPVGTNGLPTGSPEPDLSKTTPVRQFGAAGMSETQVPKQEISQQTQTLKESNDRGSKTVADHIKSETEQAKTIGDKTGTSLDNVDKSSADQSKSLDSVDKETSANTDATKEGNDVSKSGFQDANQTLDSVKSTGDQTVSGVGQTTDAVSTGSGNIVDSVQGIGSTISDAISSAISSLASMVSSSTAGASSNGGSSSGGGGTDFSPSSDGSGGSSDTSSPFPGYATGGQFSVSGKGHADTEMVQFYASPGETVTITPPGGTPPPNPSMDSHVTNGPKQSYATGGQMTLGGALGTPSALGGDAGNLIAAHVNESMTSQSAAIGARLSDMTNVLISASNSATSSILGAVSGISSSLSARGFATGGQFSVGSSGIQGFATGGQFTAGDPAGNDNTSVDTLSSDLTSRAQRQTASLSDRITSSTNLIAQSITLNGSKVTSGMTALGNSVSKALSAVSSSSSSTSSSSSVPGAGDGATYKPMSAAEAYKWINSGFYTSQSAFAGMPPAMYNQLSSQIKASGVFGGSHADGGAFTVPGGGGASDTVDVAIKASPGEKIFVLPPQEAAQLKAIHNQVRATPEPISDYLPKPQSIPGNDNATATSSSVSGWKDSSAYHSPVAASQAGSGGDRPVTIVVQDKVQADDFMRSRAQIQKAIRV